MKKHIKLLAVILGISCLCGCNNQLGVGRLDNTVNYETAKWIEKLDYSEIKEGYYISEQDNSYFVIKDKVYNLVGVDWEEYCRANISKEGFYIGTPEYEKFKSTSEYGELISKSAEEFNELYSNKTFVPIRYYTNNGESTDSYILLVTNIPAEELNSGSVAGLRGLNMKDKNTIYNEVNGLLYTYCGTSLPDNVQTQTPD